MDRMRRNLHAEEAHTYGITGKGVTAAVLDTGICDHPDYIQRVVCFKDFVNQRKDYYDDASHGSHVTGILSGDGTCSNGKYRGIAPGCNIVHLKVLDRFGQGQLSDLIRSVEWVIENKNRYHIRLMNLSAGTRKKEEDPRAKELVYLVERAWDEGITVVVAAGNMGPAAGSITIPGTSKKVITVGAYSETHGGRKKDMFYSGCGPTQSCICKPEVIAPGTQILSCSTRWRSSMFYSRKSGTSMAAPAVAGCLALLMEKEPGLSNLEVKMRLRESCRKVNEPDNMQGWGMPDVRMLLDL